jgi:pimeloyl-ACP methyl ester carboxylesterase
MTCPAPTSRSSGGRSAVSTSSGTPACVASWTAGAKFAAAVPLVHATAAGRPVAFATPRAKKPALRSSTCDQVGIRSSAARARTIGVEREPGDVQAPAIPQRASSSTKARRRRWVAFGALTEEDPVPMPETIMLLHGFGGTGRTWEAVAARIDAARYTPVAPDLRGHGRRHRHRPVSFDGCVRDVLAQAPDRPFVPGGLLDGRAPGPARGARGARARVPPRARVRHRGHRGRRRARRPRGSRPRARRAPGGHDPEAWADLWTGQPIFAGTPPEVLPAWREDLGRTPPAAAAAALRGVGTGAMAPLWDRLGELAMPVRVVAGERDTKYVEIGERLVAALPRAELVIVPGAGHGLPREAPDALAALLQQPGA